MEQLNKNIVKLVDTVDLNSIESLNSVIQNYLYNHSFNNLEVLLNKENPPSLEISHLYKKIIEDRKGGYCFEHNKLFFRALELKGFKVESTLARVVYGQDIEVPRTHRLSLLEWEDQEHLVDVGFGPYTPDIAVPISGVKVVDSKGQTYRVTRLNEGLYGLQIDKKGDFFTLYTFDKESYIEPDYQVANYFSSTHPSSKHVTSLVVSKSVEGGVIFIRNRQFSRIVKDLREDVSILSSQHLQEILANEFTYVVSDQQSEFLYSQFYGD